MTSASAANKGLFLLANFKQAVHVAYSYDRYSLLTTSSSRHAANEDYTFRGDYAIFRPSVLNGSFSLGLRLKQNYASGDHFESRFDSGYGTFYDIRGILFPWESYPLSFFTNSKIEEFSDGFGRTYEITSSGYGANLSLRNAWLPGSVNYLRSTSRTRGLAMNTRSTREDLSMHLQHVLGISETRGDIFFIQQEFTSLTTRDEAQSDSYDLRLRNTLRWQKDHKKRALNSTVKYWNSTGISERKSFQWSESLTADLGRALRSGVNYSHSRSESDRFERRVDSGRGWLQHELYKSLRTHLEGYARQNRFPTGSEEAVGGRASLGYRKTLPAMSNFSAGLYTQYQVTDRSLESASLSIFDEEHLVDFGEPLVLASTDVIAESVEVRNQDPLIQFLPYVENVDYRVEQVGNLTEIVVFSDGLSNIIPEGTILLISYDVLVNPDVRFASDSQGGNFQLLLLRDRYRIYGSYDQSGQNRISGATDLMPLHSQTTWRLGAESRWNPFTLSSEYQNFESNTNRYHYLDARLRYLGTWRDGSLMLHVENRNWWYDSPTGQALADRRTLKVGGRYRKTIFGYVHFSTWGDYLRAMGAVKGDQVTLGADFGWQYRQIALSLRGWAGFRRFSENWTREEHVRFNLTRYF